MRIDGIYIKDFAGLSAVEYRFDGSFSCIYGKNETGKTTVMRFIHMMLYGGNAVMRAACRPLSGQIPSGSLEFSDEGGSYRIERSFGKSKRSDKISLINLSTGKTVALSKEPGELYLGITEETFVRTCFVEHVGPMGDKGNEEIKTRLQNLVASGYESISAETVQKRLEDAKKNLSNKTKTKGRIVELQQKKYQLETELSLAMQKEAARSKQVERYEQQKAEIVQLQKQLARSEQQKKEQNAADLQACQTRLELLNKQLSFGSKPVSREQLALLQASMNSLADIPADEENAADAALKQRYDSLLYESALLRGSLSEKEAALKLAKEAYQSYLYRHRFPVDKLGAAVSLLLFAVALILCLTAYRAVWLAAALLGFLSLAACIAGWCLSEKRKEALRLAFHTAEQGMSALILQVSEQEMKLTAAEQELQQSKLQAEIKRQQQREALQAKQQEVVQQLRAYGYRGEGTAQAFLQRLIRASDERQMLLIRLEAFKHPMPDEAEKELSQALHTLQLKQASLFGQLRQMGEGVGVSEIEQALAQVKEEIAILQQKEQALILAQELLQKAAEQMGQQYGSMLNRKTAAYFEAICGGKYRQVAIDRELHLSAIGRDTLSQELLSAGTADQAFLALRLAIAHLIACDSKKSLPLFLDDSLMQYDDERCFAAMQLLAQIAGKDVFSSVVLFTCRSREASYHEKITQDADT